MKYLIHYLNTEPCYEIVCLMIDPDSHSIEPDINSFLEYSGNLQKVMYIEEYSFSRYASGLFDPRFAAAKNVSWIINFGGGTNQHTALLLKQFLDINNIDYTRVSVLTNSKYEFEILDSVFTEESKPGYSAVHYCDLIAIKEYLHSRKNKKFMCLSRNWNPYRLVNFIDLCSRDIIKDSYISFFNIKNIYKEEVAAYEYYNLNEISDTLYNTIQDSSNLAWKTQIQDYWETNKHKMFRRMPYTLPGEVEEVQEQGLQVMSSVSRSAYDNSYFSLIPETYMGPDNSMFQCTEKTVKAVLARHPFFVYSSQYHIKRMKQYGFKSFSDHLDEEYDFMESPLDRINAINTQVETLNNLQIYEFKELMIKLTPVTTYNYNVIMDRIDNLKSRIHHERYNTVLDDMLLTKPPPGWYHNAY